MAQPNKTRVQVATDPAFSNIVHDVEGAYTTALQVAEEVLPQGVNLYARGMHGHPTTGDSSWSTTVQFKVMAAWEAWDGSNDGMGFILRTNNNDGYGIVNMYDDIFVAFVRGADLYLYFFVLSITGTVIQLLSTKKGNYSSGYGPSICAVNTNKAVVTYHPSNLAVYAMAFRVESNYEITMGTVVSLLNRSDEVAMPTCVKIADNRFATTMYYNNNVWYGRLDISEVDDSLNITQVTAVTFATTITHRPSVCPMGDNKVIVLYRNHSVSDRLYGRVVVLNGNVATLGAIQALSSSALPNVGIGSAMLDIDKVLVMYNSGTNLMGIVVTAIGTTINYNIPFVIATTSYAGEAQAIKVSDDVILVQYLSSTTPNVNKIAKLKILNNELVRLNNEEDDIIVDPNTVTWLGHYVDGFCKVSDNTIVLLYMIEENSRTCKAKVISR